MLCQSLLGYSPLNTVFLTSNYTSNNNQFIYNYMVSSKYPNLITIIICLQIVKWFQVCLSNTNNFQTNLFNQYRSPQQIHPFQVKLDHRIITTKEYSTHLRAKELEPHHQMQFSVIPRIPLFFVGGDLPFCSGKQLAYSCSHWQGIVIL